MSEPELAVFNDDGSVKKGKNRLYKRRGALLKSLFIVLVLVGGLAYWGFYRQTHKYSSAFDECNGKSSSPIYSKAASLMSPTASGSLKVVVDNMKIMKNSEKDPSCLYAQVTYYLNIGDTPNAKIYFDKLKKVYNPKKGFVKTLRVSNDLSVLEAKVVYAEKLYSESLKNLKVNNFKQR